MINLLRRRFATARAAWIRPLGLALVFLLGASRGHGASVLINQDFSDGLNGWRMIATVFNTGQAAVLSDQGGNRVVLFQSATIPAGTPAVTLNFDFFGALSDVVPLGTTPDSVHLFVFHGQTAFGPSFDNGVFDTAIVLLNADHRGPANLAPGTIAAPSPKGAGWTRFSLSLASTPVITIAFEFIEGNGLPGDSATAVDNVLLDAAPIPEPASTGCLLISLGASLLRRRRASVFLLSHR